jgi:uncharacterized protein YbjT (DUF2867 family)
MSLTDGQTGEFRGLNQNGKMMRMRVILFGGTGMVGQGVLRVCVDDVRVTKVLMVVRKTGELGVGAGSEKVVEMVHTDFFDWSGVEETFDGHDACFFCLGTSVAGMTEDAYKRVTYDLTMGVADMLSRRGSAQTFIYVSGQGTNEHGMQMWQRVKGATENALFRLPFEWVFCFRPGFIQPMHGIRSKTGWYQAIYSLTGWLYPLLRRVAKRYVTSTDEVGEAMIEVAADGFEKRVLETVDIHAAAAQE